MSFCFGVTVGDICLVVGEKVHQPLFEVVLWCSIEYFIYENVAVTLSDVLFKSMAISMEVWED